MDGPSRTPEPENDGGLYRHVKVPVRTVNIVIIALLAVVVLLTLLGGTDGGYTVRFDSRGGSDVAPQTHPYGERVEEPPPPTREGHAFTGWYIDANCFDRFDFDTRLVEGDMTLYAGWE